MTGTKRRLGAVLMGASLVGALVMAGPAIAQDEPEEVEVEVTRHALLAHPLNDAIPNTLVTQFPPQVICLVFPAELRDALGDNEPLCGEVTNDEREQVRDNVLEPVDTNQETSPLQPAQEDTLVMEFLAGSPRYSSAFTFELPSIPDGEEWDEFTLTIPQTELTWSLDSPMFQQAVFATIATAGTGDPEVFLEQMEDALGQEPAGQPQLGIEACPLLVPVPKDAAPPQSASIDTIRDGGDEADSDDEEGNQNDVRQLQVECLVGANGKFDEDAGTWTFDLTSAARSWAGTGFTELEMHGVYLRPTGAPNLAFGDPDTSTNGRITLDVSAAMTATVASSEPPDLGSFEGFDSGGESEFGAVDDQGGGSEQGFETSVSSPATSSSGAESLDNQGGQSAPPAEVAPDESAEEPAVALDQEPASVPATGWRVWLLVPLFALGAWLMVRSLTEDVAVSGAAGGAMTRLVRGSA